MRKLQIDNLRENHNIILELKLKNNLSKEDFYFINNKINNLKKVFKIEQNGNYFYKNQEKMYDDIGPCCSFLVKLDKFKNYFEIMEYNDFLKGVRHGTI